MNQIQFADTQRTQNSDVDNVMQSNPHLDRFASPQFSIVRREHKMNINVLSVVLSASVWNMFIVICYHLG